MSGNTKRAAVLGKPIAHSLSPILHLAAYEALGLDWSFEKHEVDVHQLHDFLSANSDVAGLSLTMPLKDQAFSESTVLDKFAEQTRAVNTLIPAVGGWQGFNTDVVGFLDTFARNDIRRPENPAVIGAGATARSALCALAEMGCLEVSVYARREAAVDELKIFFPQLTIVGHNLDESAEVVGDVVVSTVPAGAADRVQLAAGTNIVFDVIYAPWPTALSKNAFALDIPVLGGLDLLVSQAVEQVLHMTQVSHDKRDVIFHAMYAAGAQEQAIRSQK